MDDSKSRETTPKAGFQVFSLASRDAGVRDYRKRKSHTKTNSGCLVCREKRVKCDEERPICARCRRNNRPCKYGQRNSSSKEGADPSAASGSSISASMQIGINTVPWEDHGAKNGTSSLFLLKHFESHWADIFHLPHSTDVLILYKTESLVRNTILAISASHLRHLAPGNVQHKIAEHFQQSLVLKEYRGALNTPPAKMTQTYTNSMLLSAMLVNMLAFTIPEAELQGQKELDPGTSWVFSPHENRLGWLALQTGYRPLVTPALPYFLEARMLVAHIFLGMDKSSWEFALPHETHEGVPELWVKFFGLNGEGSGCGHEGVDIVPGEVFRAPCIILSRLRHMEPHPWTIFRNLQFMGKVHGPFRHMLYERDEKALWLFGYFLGLMCRYENTWWCDKRVRRDYRAVQMWLTQMRLTERPGEEGETWKVMMEDLNLSQVYVPPRATEK